MKLHDLPSHHIFALFIQSIRYRSVYRTFGNMHGMGKWVLETVSTTALGGLVEFELAEYLDGDLTRASQLLRAPKLVVRDFLRYFKDYGIEKNQESNVQLTKAGIKGIRTENKITKEHLARTLGAITGLIGDIPTGKKEQSDSDE